MWFEAIGCACYLKQLLVLGGFAGGGVVLWCWLGGGRSCLQLVVRCLLLMRARLLFLVVDG